jgi:uncharacterized protein involved in exopolysaccharide biosynthesis
MRKQSRAQPVEPPGSEIRHQSERIVGAVRRHWMIAALIAASVTLLAWLVAAVQPKRYEASAIASVSPRVDELDPSDVFHGVDTLERRVVVATMAALASTPLTAQQAQAGRDDQITAIVVPTTNLFRINVQGSNAARVAAIANGTAPVLAQQARDMYRFYDVKVVSPASVPDKPALPRVERALMAGLVLGLLLGIATAYAIDRRVSRAA